MQACGTFNSWNVYCPPVRAWSRQVVQTTCRYSRALSQSALFALDSAFFFTKVTDNSSLSKPMLLLLNVAGLTGIPYSVDYAVKSVRDILFSWEAKNLATTVTAALKGLEILSNTGLQFTAFAAAIQQTSTLYGVTSPWGEATLVLSVLITLGFAYQNRQALQKVDVNSVEILEALQHRRPPTFDSALIHLLMDKDTLAELQRNNPRQELYEKVVVTNLKTQYNVKLKGQLGLLALGYVLRAIESYYTPDSLVTASINLGVSSVYTFITGLETFQEILQRRELKPEISASSNNQAIYAMIKNEQL